MSSRAQRGIWAEAVTIGVQIPRRFAPRNERALRRLSPQAKLRERRTCFLHVSLPTATQIRPLRIAAKKHHIDVRAVRWIKAVRTSDSASTTPIARANGAVDTKRGSIVGAKVGQQDKPSSQPVALPER